MTGMEIVLLLVGGLLFVANFFISERDESGDRQSQKAAKEEISRLVEEKMKEVQGHIDEVVDEAVAYSMEKTERSLERLSNEKIMAVNEYSDTVLAEIHRNHEEVMFLYDMLNDKHTNLKDTVSKANQAAKEINDTTKEAEEVVNTFQQLSATAVEVKEPQEILPKQTAEEAPFEDVPEEEEQDAVQNKNSQVLALHREGKSNVAIAKELGLGVGEVKLIVDLFKNA